MEFQKNKSHDELFNIYVQPSQESFFRTISEYYDLKQFTHTDLINIFKIYFNHSCRFSKFFFLDTLHFFKEHHSNKDYLLLMIDDFSQQFLNQSEAVYIFFQENHYLFAERNQEIDILTSENFNDVEQEVHHRELITIYEI